MTNILAIAAGGALGAVLRYGVSLGLQGVLRGFPLATLTVNVVGSLLIGIAFVFLPARHVAPAGYGFIMIGVLGAFTTFSAFSLETLRFLEQGNVLKAGLTIFLNVTLCLLAAWAGLLLARQFQ